MRLKYSEIIPDLEKTYDQMRKNGLEIDLVGNIGNKTKQIGNFFANAFNCDRIELPSLLRKGGNKTLAKTLNTVYPYFPEPVLRFLAERYKRLYHRDERILEENLDLNYLIGNHKSILLTDDNTFTGKTFEGWKNMLNGRINTSTFAITVTGDYHPDYSLIDGWRSLEWRPIGM